MPPACCSSGAIPDNSVISMRRALASRPCLPTQLHKPMVAIGCRPFHSALSATLTAPGRDPPAQRRAATTSANRRRVRPRAGGRSIASAGPL